MHVESNPGDLTPNSEERLRGIQNCIISSAGGYANQNAEPIVYSSQYLPSLKSCASVLPRDVKNCLSDLGIARRKQGVRAGRQSKEWHYNLCQIPSRITLRFIENDNKRPTFNLSAIRSMSCNSSLNLTRVRVLAVIANSRLCCGYTEVQPFWKQSYICAWWRGLYLSEANHTVHSIISM